MTPESIAGRCQCGSLCYELRARPIFTHACHCLGCRRRSGTAFGLSTIVLREDLAVTGGLLKMKQISVRTTLYLCADCDTAMYSASTRFPSTFVVRGGTFDDPRVVEPAAHIWVKRKHPWIVLPADVPQFEEDYDIHTTWPQAALDRVRAADAALSNHHR